MISKEVKLRAFAVAGSVLIIFIGLCHEMVGAIVFPFGPSVFGGLLGWHALGIGGTALAIVLLLGVLDIISIPINILSIVFLLIGISIFLYTAIIYKQFHFFALSLIFASITVIVCYKPGRLQN